MFLPIFFPAMVQVELNRYLLDLSSSNKGILGRLEESENPVGLQGLDQLDVIRSEENSINVWTIFSEKGGHVPMMMRH